MSRPRGVPSYRRHKQSGQAVVTLTDPSGARRDVLLGKYGTKQSRQEYARVLAEWEAAGRCLSPQQAQAPDISVNELALAFMGYAEQHYRRPDSTHTSEVNEYRLSLRPVVHLYGHTPAAAFGPLSLKAVRDLMVQGWTHPKHGEQASLSRGVVNQRIGWIRRIWKWGSRTSCFRRPFSPACRPCAVCSAAERPPGRRSLSGRSPRRLLRKPCPT